MISVGREKVKYHITREKATHGERFFFSLLQSHNSSEIILICRFEAQLVFFLLLTLKTVVLLNIFVETVIKS